TGNTICGDPAFAYGRLYFTSRDGKVYCFAPARDGEPLVPEAVDRSEPAAPAARVQALAAEKAEAAGPGRAWPMSGGRPERSGLEGPPLKLPLEATWKYQTGDRILCSAALADGKVFIGSDSGKM